VKLIDSYRFGEVVVEGDKFKADIIITSDGSVSNWWRREGHVLNLEDLKGILSEDLEVLVVGTGSSGAMSVPSETRDYLRGLGIEMVAEKSGSACETYNTLLGEKKVALALHLTC
jgi:hypothetical protein